MISTQLKSKNMRYLRTYESFEMNKSNCDRCGESTDDGSGGGCKTIMSMFNRDIICMKCKDVEKQDPEYGAANLADIEATKSGNRNYGGIMPDYTPISI